MTENAEDLVGQASNKVVQYVSLATMAAEALAQVRQQRGAVTAERDDKAARALRAQQRAAHAEARLQWSPVLDPRRRAGLDLNGTGLAWAAGHAWREVDPEAGVAADRATERLRELRPDVMGRYDRLTTEGLDPVEAIRRVAPFFDRPPARPGAPAMHTELSATPGAPSDDELAEDAQDTTSSISRQHYIDTGTYLGAGEAATGQSPDQLGEQPVVLVASVRTPSEVAGDGYPKPLTGAVLAAGRVKPKAPERTAPAAVRSTGLATAARAARGTR